MNNEQWGLLQYCAAQGPDQIKAEILKNGPMIAPMSAYTDLPAYGEGIYYPDQNSAFKFNGQHIVKIIGWGGDMSGEYWLVESAWGSSWGEDGVAKVMAGK